MKFTIPTTEIQTGGSLESFYYDLLVGRGDLTRVQDNGTTEVSGDLELTLGHINQILNAGGEVSEYLLAIQADVTLLGDDLPVGLPNRTTLDELAASEIRKFKNWFDTSAEVWLKDTNDKIYFLTNPTGMSISKYLTGTEIAVIINSFGGGTPSVIDRNADVDTIAQFQAEIVSGWTQIIF